MLKFCEVNVTKDEVTTTYSVERASNGIVYLYRNGGGFASYTAIDPSAITSIVSGLLLARIQDYAVEVV